MKKLNTILIISTLILAFGTQANSAQYDKQGQNENDIETNATTSSFFKKVLKATFSYGDGGYDKEKKEKKEKADKKAKNKKAKVAEKSLRKRAEREYAQRHMPSKYK